MLANIKSVINTVNNTLSKYYNTPDQDSPYEISCIGIEYCSLLVFISTIIGMATHYVNKEQIYSMTDVIYEKAVESLKILDQSYHIEFSFDVSTYIQKRTKDYEKICFGDYEPCGYYLSKDYPRYKDDQIQDGLMRCCVAFGDFSIFLIKNRRRAEFKDINPLILLDIFEMSFYSNIFISITNTIFKYYGQSLEISLNYKDVIDNYTAVKADKSNRYWDLAKPIPTVPTEKKSSSSKNGNSTAKLFLVFAIIFIVVFIAILLGY